MAELGAGAGSGYPAAIDTKQTFINTGSPLSDGPTRMDAEALNDALGALVAIEAELGIAPSGVWPTLIARLDAFLVGSVAVPQLIVAGVGPHAIGGVTASNVQFDILGTFTPSDATAGVFRVQSTLVLSANRDGYGFLNAPTLNKAGSGTHADFAGARFDAPIIGAGAAALTTVSTLKITGAPTGGTNNYPLWVDGAAASRFTGGLKIGIETSGANYTILRNDGIGSLDFIGNQASFAFYRWFATTNERMRLTDAGILALGTTVVTGAASGYLVLAYGNDLSSVDAAGSGNNRMVESNTVGGTTNVTVLSPGGAEIGWGKALVALGGGAAPTFGTIGGAGPATAAQNTWMRVIDNGGAAFWVPVWK